MFRKMPFLLVALVALIGVLHPWIPLELQALLYGTSLTIKSAIVLLLPFIIFGLLFKTAAQLVQKASKLIILILGRSALPTFSRR